MVDKSGDVGIPGWLGSWPGGSWFPLTGDAGGSWGFRVGGRGWDALFDGSDGESGGKDPSGGRGEKAG